MLFTNCVGRDQVDAWDDGRYQEPRTQTPMTLRDPLLKNLTGYGNTM